MFVTNWSIQFYLFLSTLIFLLAQRGQFISYLNFSPTSLFRLSGHLDSMLMEGTRDEHNQTLYQSNVVWLKI